MYILNGTTPTITFWMVQTDGITGLTGASITIYLSKDGAAGAVAGGAVTEIDSTNMAGLYSFDLTATETNTNGDLVIQATAASGSYGPWRDIRQVVAAVPDVNVLTADAAAVIDANVVTEDAGYTPSDATLADGTLDNIADVVIRRTMANARASAKGDTIEQYTLLGAILAVAGRNKINGASLETYQEDESTLQFTRTVTTSASADPITEVT